jgi:hypothetical protein
MTVAPDALPPEAQDSDPAATQAVADAPAEAEPKVETIEIRGQKIPTAEVAEYFDPSCDLRCDHGALTRGVPAPKEFKGMRGKIFQITALCPCAVRGYKRQHPAPIEPIAGPRAVAAAEEPDGAEQPSANPRADQVKRKRERQDELRGELQRLRARATERTADLRAELAAHQAGGRAAQHVAETSEEEAARLEQLLVDVRARAISARATAAAATAQAASLEKELAAATPETEVKGAQRLEREIEKIDRQIRTIVAYHPEASDGR